MYIRNALRAEVRAHLLSVLLSTRGNLHSGICGTPFLRLPYVNAIEVGSLESKSDLPWRDVRTVRVQAPDRMPKRHAFLAKMACLLPDRYAKKVRLLPDRYAKKGVPSARSLCKKTCLLGQNGMPSARSLCKKGTPSWSKRHALCQIAVQKRHAFCQIAMQTRHAFCQIAMQKRHALCQIVCQKGMPSWPKWHAFCQIAMQKRHAFCQIAMQKRHAFLVKMACLLPDRDAKKACLLCQNGMPSARSVCKKRRAFLAKKACLVPDRYAEKACLI